MHLDLALIAGSAVVGLLVGLTGMGGGALMTPMLVLLFGVAPSAAISSDLVAALFMKPAGVVIHWRRRTVQHGIVRYLALGSVPAALLGTFTMHEMGNSAGAERALQTTLGVALMLGAVAMLGRAALNRQTRVSAEAPVPRPLATFLVGVVGGFMVGLTSVGAGSLILVLLLLVYPSIRNDHLIGTDLTQSLPLTLAATAGTLLFGHVAFGLTASIIVGSVPAVVVGALISAQRSSARLRPVITGLVLLTGLKYVGVPVAALGVCALAVAAVVAVVLVRAARRNAPVVLETVTS
jgi:uncharacterized membrane protein YfcA